MMRLVQQTSRFVFFTVLALAGVAADVLAQPGNAIQFTKASSQYGATPSGTTLNTAQFTVEFWVKLPENSTWDFVLDHGYQVVSGSQGWYIANGSYTGAANAFMVAGIRNSGTVKEIYLPINTTEWTHVAFTFDGTTLSGYKNGVFSLSVNLDGGATYSPTYSRPLFFGTRGNWNGTVWNPAGYNDDLIDEVRIFNTAVSAQTLSRRYMAPMSAEHPNNANLIAHWKLDEASGTSASEVGGIERTFSYVNAPPRVASGARIFAAGVSSITPLVGTEQTVLTAATWGNITAKAFFGSIPATPVHVGNGVVQVTVPKSAPSAPVTFFGNGLSKTAGSLVFRKTMAGTAQSINGSSLTGSISEVGGNISEMFSGDLDGDRKPELMWINYSNQLNYKLNQSSNGTAQFGATQTMSLGAYPDDVKLGDIDGDGKLDLVVGHVNNFDVSVYLNQSTTGSISFGGRQQHVTNKYGKSVFVDDLDGDGKQDVVMLDKENSSTFVLLRNTTTGTSVSFAQTNFVPSARYPDMKLVDMNGDGLSDIVALRYVFTGSENGASSIRIFYNRSTPGTISFSSSDYADFTGLNEPTRIAVSDLDADGKPDFLVSQNGSASARWYLNTTSGSTLSFSSGTFSVFGYNAQWIGAEDINGDGKAEALLQSSGGFWLHENTSTTGAVSFGSGVSFGGSQDTYATPVIEDFNNDGKIDVISSYVSGNWGWRLYSNNASIPNFALSSTTIAKGSVNFGTTRDSVLVSNSGGATLTISNIVSSHASLVPDFTSTTVSAGGSKYIPFTQMYGSTGAQSNTLTITHNGPGGSATVMVTYTGSQAAAANAGNRVTFDGTNDYLTRSGVFTTATDNIAMEGWFYATSVTGGNRILMYNGSTGSSGYGLFLNTSGEIRALLGGVAALTSGITMPANEWMHLVLTRESGIWKLYVDGELKTLSSNTTAPAAPSGSITIGANPAGSERFAGSADEVRFWTTARTQTQIRQSYASRVGNESGLAAYYRFDQSSTTYVNDYTTNGNHLTAMNGPAFSSSTAPVSNPSTASNFTPLDVTFGNRVVGSIYRDSVTLNNTSGGIIHYEIGTPPAPFTVSSTSVAVKLGQSKKIYYTFAPTAAQAYGGNNLTYGYQFAGTTYRNITGTGVFTAPTSAGNALSFDGTDDFMEIMDATDPTAYTIEAWVRFSAITPGTAQNIITRTSASGPNTHHTHTIFLTSTGTFGHYAFFDQNASGTVTGTTTVQPNRWYHVAITAQNSGMMRLFVNGVEEGTALAVQTLWTAGDRWSVGASSANNSRVWFNGQLDELRIWSVARTQAEIQGSYAPVAGNATNLSRIWRFDESSGSVAYDGTTNNVQGTVNGATRVTTTAPVAAPTVILSAYAFGNVEAGTSSQLIRYLKNSGGGVAHVSLSENGSYYTMSPATASILNGDSVAVTTTFAPVATGAQNATLSITGNATGSAAISGTGVVSVNGSAGNALVLNGSRSGTIPRMISDDFTIEFFVKTTQSAGASTGNWYSGQGIVDAEVGGFNNDFGISMGNGKLLFGVGNPDVSVRSKFKINDGLWHHVAATRNKTTGRIVLFIDGIPHDSATGNTASLTAATNIAIGQLQTGINPFVGTLDELRIWNVAKTGSQIRSTINATVAGTASGLVGYLRFDAATGNTFQNLVNAASVLTMNSVAQETPTTAPLPGGYPMLSATSLAFSSREVGSTTELQATLTNFGSGAITISSVTSTNPAFSGSASVSSVAINGTSTISVNFTPSAVTSYSDTIRIFHSGVGGVITLPVSGSGAQAVYAAATTKAFGAKRIGSSHLDSVLVQNPGGWALAISNATISGSGYTVPATTANIPAGGSAYFKVNFSPVAVQSYPAWLILTHNGVTSPDSVQLSGTGAQGGLSIVTPSISFGMVDTGTAKSDSVQVNSTGAVSVTITGISSTNARFSSSSTGEINASESKWIKVSFAPNAVGAQNGSIVITHNGPTSPDTILVSGTGSVPPATTTGNSFRANKDNYYFYTNVPYSAGLNPSSNFTFELWTRPAASSTQHQTPLTSRNTFQGYQIYLTPSNASPASSWQIVFGNGSEWKNLNGPAASFGFWTHLAGVFTADSVFLYVNGDRVAGMSSAGFTANTSMPFRIGSISESVNYLFNGEIDEVRFWDVAKTQSEIRSLMQNSQSGGAPNLQGYWRFDEASGSTAADSSPNGRNGTRTSQYGYTVSLSHVTTAQAPIFKAYLLAQSASVNFGRVSLASDSTRVISFKNIGGKSAVFGSASSTNAAFTFDNGPATLASLASGNFEFTFAPQALGNATGSIVLNWTANSAADSLSLSVSGSGSRTDFALQTTPLEDISSRSVALVDVDRDGDLDVHLTGYNGGLQNRSLIYSNNGSGTFGETPVSLASGYSNAVWADFDNDGDMDAFQGGNSQNYFRNNGNNTFTALVIPAAASIPNAYGAMAMDVNNDGLTDLIVQGSSHPNTWFSVLKNNGDNTFSQLQTLTIGSENVYEKVDWDGDGWMDILVSVYNYSQPVMKWWKNVNGTFVEKTIQNMNGVRSGSIAVGDYDNDGRPDVFVSGVNDWISGYYHRWLYKNLNDSTAQFVTNIGPLLSQTAARFFDVDSDGDLDLILSGSTSNYAVEQFVYINDNGTWVEGSALGNYYGVRSAVGDLNADGKPDYVTVSARIYNNMSPSTRVWFNQNAMVNAAPGAPANLTAEFDGENIRFSWDVATDAQGGPLTYNIRIGTSPGGIQIVSPHALSNGTRLIGEAGNTGYRKSFVLAGVDLNKTFYWSVQAVDGANLGGSFAEEVVYTNTVQAAIGGNTPGWRFITSPAPGTTFAELLANIWTQGATGGDTPAGSPNVYAYNEVTAAWQAVTDLNVAMEMGRGYAVFVYDRNTFNDAESNVWPKVLSSNRKPSLADRNLALTYTSGRTFSGYNLVGNPFPFPIDMEAETGFTRTGVGTAHYIYRAETGSYATYINGVTGLNGGSRHVAPYQGFWVVAEAEGSIFGLKRAARHSGGPASFLKQANEDGMIRLAITNGKRSDETVVRIAEKPLGFEVVQMEAMTADYAFVFTNGTGGKKLDLFEVNRNDARTEIPVRIQAAASDSLSLTWPELKNLPEHWDAVLQIDGQTIDLKKGTSWTWKSATAAKAVAKADSLMPGGPAFTTAGGLLEWNAVLLLGSGVLTSLENERERPAVFEVRPNYPNPFNPATTLRFGLPAAGEIDITVFDLTGRQVATVARGIMPAGWHNVSFNAAKLSSGTYVVRFRSGSNVHHQKITLLK
jgi:hypothetical protein